VAEGVWSPFYFRRAVAIPQRYLVKLTVIHADRFGALGLATDAAGTRLYVVDSGNNRLQYFNYKKSDPAVEPTSLGRVKAIFR
jgi:DNA-binding beta-propeller fold protein YncE